MEGELSHKIFFSEIYSFLHFDRLHKFQEVLNTIPNSRTMKFTIDFNENLVHLYGEITH